MYPSKKFGNLLTFLLFVVGALLNFMPILLRFSLKDPSTGAYPDYLSKLSSFEYSVSLVVGICANVFILIDYVFDCFLRRVVFYGNFSTQKSCTPAVYVPLREWVIYLLIPDILILVWLIPYECYEGMLVMLNARDTMYTYSILMCLTNFSNPVWTWKAVILIGVPFMISNLMASFEIFLSSGFLVVLSSIFTSLGLLSLMVYIRFWIIHIANLKVEEVSGTDTILCSAYLIFFSVFLLGNWTVSYFPTNVGDPWSDDEGVDFFTWYAYLMAGCTLCMTVMSSCCAKLAAAETKVTIYIFYYYSYLRIVQ